MLHRLLEDSMITSCREPSSRLLPGAVEPLIQALKDDNAVVRQNVAGALRKFNDTRAVGPLIQALKDDDIVVDSNGAEYFWGMLNDTRAIDRLILALKDDKGGPTECHAEALCKFNDMRTAVRTLDPGPQGQGYRSRTDTT